MARQIDLDQLMKYPLRRGSEHCDEKNADPRFLNGVESILGWAQTLPTLTPPNEWISVDERLPDEELNQIKRLFPGENEVEVLVMIEGAYIATTLYWDGEKFYDETSTYEVTHWMPLPAPPEKEHDHE